MGFIENNKALCMLSVLINTHLMKSAHERGCERYFYASSACIYPDYRQTRSRQPGPQGEPTPTRPCPRTDTGGRSSSASGCAGTSGRTSASRPGPCRYHNVYGPHGTWAGGREKAPAAICRKVAEAVIAGTGTIPIWGDGKQSRSFMYVDDCVEGTRRMVESEVFEPLNLGSDEMVTIDELVSIVEDIAGVELERVYDTTAPQGVRGRNSDNDLIKEKLGWAPSVSLRDGLEQTYRWVFEQVATSGSVNAAPEENQAATGRR